MPLDLATSTQWEALNANTVLRRKKKKEIGFLLFWKPRKHLFKKTKVILFHWGVFLMAKTIKVSDRHETAWNWIRHKSEHVVWKVLLSFSIRSRTQNATWRLKLQLLTCKIKWWLQSHIPLHFFIYLFFRRVSGLLNPTKLHLGVWIKKKGNFINMVSPSKFTFHLPNHIEKQHFLCWRHWIPTPNKRIMGLNKKNDKFQISSRLTQMGVPLNQMTHQIPTYQ